MTTPAGSQQQPVPPTQPVPPQTPPGWEVLARNAAIILGIETAAVAATAPLRAQIQGVVRAAMAAWITAFGALDAPADPVGLHTVAATLIGGLDRVDPRRVAATVEQRVQDALHTGAGQARGMLAEQVSRGAPAPERGWAPHHRPVLDAVVRNEVDKLAPAVQAAVDDAAAAARKLDAGDGEVHWRDVQDVADTASRTVTSAERRAAWSVNAAANDGMAQVAAEVDAERVWVAERDACVVCLALSGDVSVDGHFSATATFGRKPLAVWPPGPLAGPPRHPNCRCRAEVWLGTHEGYTGTALPAALKREAERSILTGWRMDSESETVRLRAAKDLLARGTGLPKSVRARAVKAVARGAFGPFPRTHLRRDKTAAH